MSKAGSLSVSTLEEHPMDGPMTGSETRVAALRELLKTPRRAERPRPKSTERRALYEEALELQDAIGPVPFRVVDLLREIRDDG